MKIPPEKIKKFIETHFQYKVRRDGEEYIINNPFNYDTGYHFNINVHKALCHDWRGDDWAGPPNPISGKRSCGFIKFVSLYLNVSIKEAYNKLSISYTPTRKDEKEEIDKIYELKLPKNQKLYTDNNEIADILKRWLKKRGYTQEELEKNDIRYDGFKVIWPYYEFEEIVYWQARSYMNKRFEFPSTQVFENGKLAGKVEASKGMFLYGFDDIEFNSYVIVTEAIFDKHSLGEQTVASGGASLTDEQLKKLKILNPIKGIILAPDNDKAGVASIVSNYWKLKPLGYPIYASYFRSEKYDGLKDWNELIEKGKKTKEEVRDIFEASIIKVDVLSINKLVKNVGF